ncbi:MAG TPA: sigma-70 family RNA polymerase sigma factor [Thermoanaerobaculia bacterium]
MDVEIERELIERCRRGSTASFESLVRTHQRPALAIAEALLGNVDDAADAVQEAFVKAFRSLGRLREGSTFGPWFRSILRNHCRDLLRAPRPAVAEWSEQSVDPSLWTEPTAQLGLEREELGDAVRTALGRISPEHREILVLKEIEELSYAEIAAAMNIPAGTVASRLHHARAALRRALQKHGQAIEGALR